MTGVRGWTLEDVARMRLLSQRLVGLPSAGLPVSATPGEVVRHLTCVQGQDYPGSTVSVALRTQARALAEVRAAYDAGKIVRSWPMRGTLFVVPAEDLGWMLSLTGDGVRRQTARRREQLGLGGAELELAERVAREVLAGEGLTRAGLLEAWTRAGLAVEGGRGYHLIFHLAVAAVLCQGPTEGKEQRFVLSEKWIRGSRQLDREEAVAEWLLRYVLSHGPVPVADFLWWTKLLRRDVAPVLDGVRKRVGVIEVDGVEHWMDPGVLEAYSTPAGRRATAAALLLPGFDELVLGYGDRRAVLTKEEEGLVVPGGNGVFKATLVRSGRAVGTWTRPTRKGTPVTVTSFGTLPATVEKALPRLTAGLPT